MRDLVHQQVAEVRDGRVWRDPDDARALHAGAARRLDDPQPRPRIGPEPRLELRECGDGGALDRGGRRAGAGEHDEPRVADLARTAPVVGGGVHHEVPDVGRDPRGHEAVRGARGPAPVRDDGDRDVGPEPEGHPRADQRHERVPEVGAVERGRAADPRHPSVEAGHAVGAGEQPRRPAGGRGQGRAEGDPDDDGPARREHAAERNGDRLVVEGGPDRRAVDRDLAEVQPPERAHRRVQPDPVDRRAGQVGRADHDPAGEAAVGDAERGVDGVRARMDSVLRFTEPGRQRDAATVAGACAASPRRPWACGRRRAREAGGDRRRRRDGDEGADGADPGLGARHGPDATRVPDTPPMTDTASSALRHRPAAMARACCGRSGRAAGRPARDRRADLEPYRRDETAYLRGGLPVGVAFPSLDR